MVHTAHPLIRSIPNAVSVIRVLLIPICLFLAEQLRQTRLSGEGAPTTLLVLLLLLLGFSDLLDGWLARRYDLVTNVGATLDAVADKLAQVAFVSYFTFREIPGLTQLPIWLFAVVIARDLLLGIGYMTVRLKRGIVDTEHRAHGKVASLLLFFVILSVVLEMPPVVTISGAWLSASLIILSTVGYLGEGARSR